MSGMVSVPCWHATPVANAPFCIQNKCILRSNSLRCWSVYPYPVSSVNIYPMLCRGHSWRVRIAKQETLTPPGHLVSPLVCRGPWMSTVVLYCLCYSDRASVLLYFTLTIFSSNFWASLFVPFLQAELTHGKHDDIIFHITNSFSG